MTDDSVYGPYGSGKGTLGKPTASAAPYADARAHCPVGDAETTSTDAKRHGSLNFGRAGQPPQGRHRYHRAGISHC